MSNEEKLLEIYKRLPDGERDNLLLYAEFLESRCEPRAEVIPRPEPVPRPESETVVGAIKRLSGVYHMVDRAKLLDKTSALMSQHLIQGRDVVEVIDELEEVFQREYERQFGGGPEGQV